MGATRAACPVMPGRLALAFGLDPIVRASRGRAIADAAARAGSPEELQPTLAVPLIRGRKWPLNALLDREFEFSAS